ncbi:MAG TPA: hypothetical protein VLH09_09510 [Bryobacteraceae bacterium]|nr:hypothetical protein [Bryobacteraceae bacterium]
MKHPEGRVGLRAFLQITGISKSRFFRDFRFAERWIAFFDIRQTDRGCLNFDVVAAREFAARSMGTRVTPKNP